MKKLLIGALMVMGVFGTAQASELYWMIADNATVDGVAVADTSWSVAKLYASADGSNFKGEVIESWTKDWIDSWGFAQTEVGSYDASRSFFVELCDSSGTRLGASYVSMGGEDGKPQGATSMVDLKSSIAASQASMANPYQFTTFTTSEVVPEPTTGLLMLFGLAGLALRRRRA